MKEKISINRKEAGRDVKLTINTDKIRCYEYTYPLGQFGSELILFFNGDDRMKFEGDEADNLFSQLEPSAKKHGFKARIVKS